MSSEALRNGLNLLIRRDRMASRVNTIPITKNTSEAHWWALTRLARHFVRSGTAVVLEATFERGGRADLYLPELSVIIEVLQTESLDEYAAKVSSHYNYIDCELRVGHITVGELEDFGIIEGANLAMSRARVVYL